MAANGTILIVDDDPMIRGGLRRMLAGQGYTVEAVESAEKAHTFLAHTPVDLVITDLQMPGQDGLAFLKDVKARRSHLPVIMLTGHGSMEVVVQALRYGASDFLSKPYQPNEIFGIVAREIKRYRQTLPPGAAEGVSLQINAQQADEIDRLLVNLRVEINARATLLIEGNGSVIAAKGALDELNIAALGALVAGDFAATAGIASLIGEEEAFQLNFHEGVQYSIYSGQVAKGIYLLVVFGQDVRLGAVLFYTKETLAKLKPIVEEAIVQMPSPPAPPQPAAPLLTPPTATPAPPPLEPPAFDEPQELFSFADILESGKLDPELSQMLEQQFSAMWQPD